MVKVLQNDRLKVLCVTNLLAPYRVTLWENLGVSVDLHLVLVEGYDRKVLTKVRNADWKTRDGQNFTAENLEVLNLRTRLGNFQVSWRLIHMFKTVANVDVLMAGAWESPIHWQYIMLAKLLRKPIVLFHGSTDKSANFTRGVVRMIKSAIFKSVDAVVVYGAAAHRSVRSLGVDENRIFEGFNAVDMDHFRRPRGDAESLLTTGSGGPGHHFIYVGQLIERKRVDLLVQEFARIRRPQDRLSIIGKGVQEKELRELALRLGVAEEVFFLGEVSYRDLPKVIWGAETLVLPSSVEVWGLVVNEALAAGLHVVVADRCGVSDSVCGMQGVFIWKEDEVPLGELLLASADSWTGPIENPAILAYSNARYADRFMESFQYVISGKRE